MSMFEGVEAKQVCTLCGKGVNLEGERVVVSRQIGEPATVQHSECDMKAREDEFLRTGHMSTWLVDHASVEVGLAKLERERGERARCVKAVHLEVDAAATRVGAKVKEFERRVWFGALAGLPTEEVLGEGILARDPGFRKLPPKRKDLKVHGESSLMVHIDKASTQVSIHYEGLNILTSAMCGRVMLTIGREMGAEVTMVTEDGVDLVSRMFLRGIQGTEAEVMELLETAMRSWEAGARPVPNTKIRMI